jgi:hypothetical protein
MSTTNFTRASKAAVLNHLVHLFNLQLANSSTYIRHQDMAESSSSSRVALPTAHTPNAEPSATLAVLQTINGHKFNSLAEVAEHFKSLEPED